MCRYCAALGFRAIPGIACAGASNLQRSAILRIGEKVERLRIGNCDGHDIAGPRDVAVRRHLEVNEPRVLGATGETVGGGILAGLSTDEDAHVGADELLVLFPRDLVLKGGQALVALLHDLFGHLVGERCRRGAGANRVLEGECGREARLADNPKRLLEVLFGLAGKPTMMSVVIAAFGILARTRSRIPRNFSDR